MDTGQCQLGVRRSLAKVGGDIDRTSWFSGSLYGKEVETAVFGIGETGGLWGVTTS